MAKKPKDESAKSSSKSERQAKGSKPKSSRKDAKPKAKRGDKREDKARVERPEPAAATSGEALQEWVEDHTPAAPRPVAAVGALTEGMTEPGAPRELGLGERYLVDRAVARALRPALLVLLVVALAALWWGNRLREDRDASRSFAAQTELDAADVRSGRNEVAGLVELPLTALLDLGNHGAHWIRRGGVRHRAPHLRWQAHRIWGATRLILAELAARLD